MKSKLFTEDNANCKVYPPVKLFSVQALEQEVKSHLFNLQLGIYHAEELIIGTKEFLSF